jgi:hypothetical protein
MADEAPTLIGTGRTPTTIETLQHAFERADEAWNAHDNAGPKYHKVGGVAGQEGNTRRLSAMSDLRDQCEALRYAILREKLRSPRDAMIVGVHLYEMVEIFHGAVSNVAADTSAALVAIENIAVYLAAAGADETETSYLDNQLGHVRLRAANRYDITAEAA